MRKNKKHSISSWTFSSVVTGMALGSLLVGCGQAVDGNVGNGGVLEEKAASANDTQSEQNFVFGLDASADTGFVKAKGSTYFKVSTAQSSSLAAKDKCLIAAGKSLPFSSTGKTVGGHVEVTLDRPVPGCAFTTGYFFESHVEFEKRPLFVAIAKFDTRFKSKPVDSSTLPASEWCTIPKGIKFYMSQAASEVSGGHVQTSFLEGELAGCQIGSGYLIADHFEQLDLAQSDLDFRRVMEHILYWEGGCSDHPNDPGGRTYKGITTSRARMNGWTADVCTMPHTMVLDIYRKDYWNNRAKFQAWPLNLAVMNTEVNSGGGRAQQFLDRMKAQGIEGTLQEKASWFVDQQTAYYKQIAENNVKLRVFLKGWLNRSNYMQDVIWERRGFSLEDALEHPVEPTAKAFE